MKDVYDLSKAENIAKIKRRAEKFKPLLANLAANDAINRHLYFDDFKRLINLCLNFKEPANLLSDQRIESQFGAFGITQYAHLVENFNWALLVGEDEVTPEEKKASEDARKAGKKFDLPAYREKKYDSSEEIRRFATTVYNSFIYTEKLRKE